MRDEPIRYLLSESTTNTPAQVGIMIGSWARVPVTFCVVAVLAMLTTMLLVGAVLYR